MMRSGLCIAVIDDNLERAQLIEAALLEAGHTQNFLITAFAGLARQLESIAPDVIIMDLGTPNRDFLEHMFRLSKAIHKPVAMFVDGLKRERIKSILDLAIMRFRAFDRLRQERDEAMQALDERKVIDRAKGIIMRQRSVNEVVAFETLRSAAMKQGRRIGQIAAAVVQADAILGETSS
jgi:two-component system, response regulator / RNA-binding antiterminator